MHLTMPTARHSQSRTARSPWGLWALAEFLRPPELLGLVGGRRPTLLDPAGTACGGAGRPVGGPGRSRTRSRPAFGDTCDLFRTVV